MMDIKDTSGNIRFSTEINRGSKRKFLLMKEDYITLRFSLSEPVHFNLGDYVDDSRFGLFELCDFYKPVYNRQTEGYDYELRLDAYYWKWKNKIFKYTPEAAGQEASWSLTAPLDVQAGILLRNLKALGYTYKGQDFEFVIDGTVENKALLMSYDNINLLDACFEMAKKWGCECWVTGNVIRFGRCEFGDPVDLEIGVNVEEMTRSDSQNAYATRVYAFGGTRNLPANYRPVDESVVVNGVVQRRLMLPAGIPYIDAYPDMRTEEAIEQVIVLDDIYPRRTGTMSGITTHEYVDKIEKDDGTTTEKRWNAYRFKDTGITFSEDYLLAGEELKIAFQSGKLNGMTFAVTFNPDRVPEKNEDGSRNPAAQVWEIIRNADYGRDLPGDVLVPEAGDTYVLSGWDATRIAELGLVDAAERELKEETEKYVAKSKIDPNTYTNKMMSDRIYDANGLHHLLGAGDRVNLINKAYFEKGRRSRVIGLEYNLDCPFDSPVYTVGETAAYSRMGELEEKIENVTLAGQTYTGGGGSGVYVIRRNDSTPATDSNVFSALRSLAEFISKKKPDTAAGIITFLKGILIGKKGHGIAVSDSNAVTAMFDELKNVFSIVSPDFVSGDLGAGFMLKYDKGTERSYLEVDELLVRKLAYFVELVIKRLSYVGGEIILTPASMKCSRVEVHDTFYRCYFEQSDGDKSIMPEFRAGDQARCQTFNVQEGASHDVSNTYYWRLVTAVGENYIDLSVSDCDAGSTVPVAGDHIVQLGNREDATRRNAIVLSTVGDDAPSIKQYKGIDSYSLAGKEVTILSPVLNKFIGRFVSEATGKNYDDLFSELQAEMELVREQTDREFTLWFFEYDPTLSNAPASDWTTDELKAMHEQDMFYNRLTGYAYRFERAADGTFSWNSITDQQTVKALENAAKAQDTADGKRRVFVERPADEVAYDVGDLWVNATYEEGDVVYDNDELVCVTAKAAGEAFNIGDWKPTNSATTATIRNLGERIELLVTDIGNNTSAIELTDKSISALVEGIHFDDSGKITNINTSGLVMEKDFNTLLSKKVTFDKDGHVTNIDTTGFVTSSNFASQYAQMEAADGYIKRSEISSFITKNEDGTFTSNALVSADQIRFNGNIVANDTFVVDKEGNLVLNNITANNLNLSGNIDGLNATLNNIVANNITLSGNITADNAILSGIIAEGLRIKNGEISGILRANSLFLGMKYVNSGSKYDMSYKDCLIYVLGTTIQTVYLPIEPYNGQLFVIKNMREDGKSITVSAMGGWEIDNNGYTRNLDYRGSIILMGTGNDWTWSTI